MRLPLLLLPGLLALAAPAAETNSSAPKTVLKGLDPVALASGNEVPGLTSLAVVRGAHRYLFATEVNRASFARDTARHGIQFGGACMRMGPLAGGGDVNRFQVHDGHIYLFASDGCRNTFNTDPESFIDRADPVPEGTDDAAKKAASLLAKAVEALGGPATLRAVSACEIRYQITSGAAPRETKFTRVLAMSFPATCAHEDDYGTWRGGWRLLGEQGYLSWESDPVEESVRQCMVREFHRQPVAILKAWQRGDAVAFAAGPGRVGESAVERVTVAVRGATSTLGIEPDSGRILQIAFRDRAGGRLSSIQKAFADFRPIKGVTLPFETHSVVNGKPVTSTRVVIESIQINEPIPPRLLTKPEPPVREAK